LETVRESDGALVWRILESSDFDGRAGKKGGDKVLLTKLIKQRKYSKEKARRI